MLEKFSCCYFPTKVLMIDDNEAFTSNLDLAIEHQTISCNNPVKGVHIAQIDHVKPEFINQCLTHIIQEQIADQWEPNNQFSKDFSILYKMIASKKLFDKISVLLVDYNMPEMTGIEVCRLLKSLPTRKIMLTAEEDLAIAIDAFNEGMIHQFITKKSSYFIQEIKSAIEKQQHDFFEEISQPLLPYLSENIIQNPHYQHLLFDLKTKLKPTEYYLLDSSGSFLFIRENTQTIFAVRTASEIEAYYHIAKDNDAEVNVINELQNKTGLIFLPQDSQDVSTNEWHKHLYPAQLIPGMADVYFALI